MTNDYRCKCNNGYRVRETTVHSQSYIDELFSFSIVLVAPCKNDNDGCCKVYYGVLVWIIILGNNVI